MNETRKLKLKGQVEHRSFEMDKTTANEESRTVEIAFSSTAGVQRKFGLEVLDHSPSSVRMDRLNNGSPVLVNHDSSDQIGVVESARIDGGAVGRAVIRFSRSARGEEIFNDVKDGIRRLVSVGYSIHEWEEREERGQLTARVTDWEPFEISIVPIPADISVGVGRNTEKEFNLTSEKRTMTEELKDKATEPAQKIDIKVERDKIRSVELDRVRKIRSMADTNGLDDLGKRAIEEEWDYSKFNEEALNVIGQRNQAARSKSQETGNVDLSKKDQQKFSFVRLMDALSNPQDRAAQQRAGFELEVSDAAVKKIGHDFKARGAFIPDEILTGQRDLSVGTPAAGGNLVGTQLMAGSFIDLLRNSQITAAAGVQTMSGLVGNVDIPRQTGGASMTWLTAEDVEATESDPTFDQVVLAPKDAAVFTEVTRRLLQQSTPAIEGLVKADLAQAIGLGTDRAVLYGSAASGQPRGVRLQSGINTVDLVAANPTWAETVAMVREVMVDNALMGNLAFLINPVGWAALNTTEKAANTAQYIMDDAGKVAGYNALVSNQVTAGDYWFGNWGSVIIGEWGGLEMNVDPFTHALRGRVRYIVFKTMDVAVRQPGSFCYANITID
jgi:HK97 family phage major capsid protein